MAIFSALRPIISRNASILSKNTQNPLKLQINKDVVRFMSGHGPRTFVIEPTRWQWHKFKDLLHMYLLVGAIPVTAVLFYCNVFIGPATLTEIPSGYEPKHYEYYRHPLTRFLARYMKPPPQQEYEKQMHMMYEEAEKELIRKLTAEIELKMSQNQDYQAYYFYPAIAKYHRVTREATEEIKRIYGE